MKKKREIIEALARLRSYRIGPISSIPPSSWNADDRTIALIAATNLEHSLEDAIASHFKGDTDKLRKRLPSGSHQSEGAVSTFFAKAWLSHALGDFGPNTMEDLSTIRDIRNTFAHSAIEVSFETPAIADACGFRLLDRIPWTDRLSRPTTSRDAYIYATHQLSGMIFCVTSPPSILDSETIEAFRALLS